MIAAAGARCAAHPEREAVEPCSRCGTFVCGECRKLRGTDALCPACFARPASWNGASYLALTALVLTFVGLGCTPLAPIGMLFAIADLIRGARGGKKLDALALGLGVLGIVLGVLMVKGLIDNPHVFDEKPDP